MPHNQSINADHKKPWQVISALGSYKFGGFVDFAKAKGKTDEWYTPKSAVSVILPHITNFSTIWCPFDKEESEFVQQIQKTHKVITSHIDDGKDFLTFLPSIKFDCIVSNPPYSIRNEILKRAFQINKPFALLMNTNGLFDSSIRWGLFKDKMFTLFYLKGRVNYMKSPGQNIKGSPPFQSAYICFGMFNEKIVFEPNNQMHLTPNSGASD